MKPIPTINVNLAQCACGRPFTHMIDCSGSPVPTPCPIPPSVTFTVQLAPIAECIFPCTWTSQYHRGPHHETCPARPIRVSCSISGKTWEESEVGDVEHATEKYLMDDHVGDMVESRWALVKALVLGKAWGDMGKVTLRPPFELFAQRDAVFAALTDMARHEDGLQDAAQRAATAMGADGDMGGAVRASPEFLASYVARLIEQVGVLEGGI